MYRNHTKRLLDIVFSLLLLPLIALIFFIIAPIIHIYDGGPVLFNGERLGYRGAIFKMYKFRSMYINAPDVRNADGSTYNGTDDSRVTKIGKFLRKTSLDETPQLFNVLKGDMSFVGPRPGLPEIGEYLTNPDERHRREVRPGITGYSQAYYRNSDTSELRMYNDIQYADNMSFTLDLKILVKTMDTVLARKNVYRKQEYSKEQ